MSKQQEIISTIIHAANRTTELLKTVKPIIVKKKIIFPGVDRINNRKNKAIQKQNVLIMTDIYLSQMFSAVDLQIIQSKPVPKYYLGSGGRNSGLSWVRETDKANKEIISQLHKKFVVE